MIDLVHKKSLITLLNKKIWFALFMHLIKQSFIEIFILFKKYNFIFLIKAYLVPFEEIDY